MRLRPILVVGLVLTGLIFSNVSTTQARGTTPYTCDNQNVKYHLKRVKALLAKGYDQSRWEDKTPLTDEEKDSIREHKFCLTRNEDRAKVAKFRDKAREAFDAYRYERLITPFEGPNGTHWAIPYSVVWCETKGINYSPHGYYALVSWSDYGGGQFASTASQASFLEQSIVAKRMYDDRGLQPWYPSQHCWG